MNRFLRICSVFCAFCLMLVSCKSVKKEEDKNKDPNTAKEAIEGYGRMEITKNERFTMFVDFSLLNIIVVDRVSGKEWSTNPVDADQDPIANMEFLPRLKAQFDVSYIVNRSVRNIDSYSECVEKEQYKVYSVKDGVRIDYTLGDIDLAVEDLPKMLSGQRADALILKNPALSEEQKAYFTACYTQADGSSAWAWKPNNFGSKVNDVISVFQTIGYKQEDLRKDSLEFGLEYTATEKIGFYIPVIYTLTENGLRIDVPSGEIACPEGYPILELNLCPYFGASQSDKNGYIFMPDGSGTLIEFKKTAQKVNQLSLPIYSQDMTKGKKDSISSANPVLLPVFGLKTGDSAFFSIVENGDAIGKLSATRAGTLSSYNHVGASFTLCAQDSMDLSGIGTGASEVTVLQTTPYEGHLTVRYAFLNGDDADYSGMAKTYREYLVKTNGFEKQSSAELPIYIDTIGALESNKNFLGINYKGPVSVTSYAQSLRILDELRAEGIQTAVMRMMGWLNGGYEQTSLIRFQPVAELGKKSELKELISKGNVYLNVSFLTVPNSKNVALAQQASYTIDQQYARYLKNGDRGGEDTTLNPGYILSVNQLPSLADKLIGKLKDYQGYKLSLSDLGNAVYADYKKSRETGRQQAISIVEKQIEKLSRAAGKPMVASANIHTARYASHIVEAPLNDSAYFVADKEIPFYQMVMHGLVSYAGSPLNLSSTTRDDILKAAESGAGLYYRFTYEDSAAFEGIQNLDLFSAHYAAWRKTCVEEYKALNKVCGGLNDQLIIKHQFINDTCTVTTYENGTKIAVNYGSQSVLVEGQDVAPYSYAKVI